MHEKLALITMALALWGCAGEIPSEPPREQGGRGGIELYQVLGGGEGFAQALGPRDLRFPRDHGAHERFRSEWWYLTGNLVDDDGRRFGFQFTVFRQAIAPPARIREWANTSAWRTGQLFLAHFALTDAQAARHRAFERAGRGALGLAGAEIQPFRVWVDGWSLASTGASFLPLRLDVRTGAGDRLCLVLERTKPMVLQGDGGFSRKSARRGNASYYYAYTRLAARGSLQRADERVELAGSAWMDREWSSSVLEREHSGWDWFAMQLADGRDLMVYRLRRRDGRRDAFDAGTLVHADGHSESLSSSDFELTPQRFWVDERGVPWPLEWRLALPGRDLAFEITPVLEDQLMRTSFRYWEGAVNVRGSAKGVGYMELTGYGDGNDEAR